VFTGLAGGVFAGINHSLGPDVLSPALLLFVLSMMVVGGRGTKWGPILGAAALMLADIILRDFPGIRVGGLSLIIILFMIFLPRGLAGLVDDIFHWRPVAVGCSLPEGCGFKSRRRCRHARAPRSLSQFVTLQTPQRPRSEHRRQQISVVAAAV
jgi:hypothetical protein